MHLHSFLLIYYAFSSLTRLVQASSSLLCQPFTHTSTRPYNKRLLSHSILHRIRGGTTTLGITDSEDDSEQEIEQTEDQDETSDAETQKTKEAVTTSSLGPVKVTLRTNMASPIIDQSIEFTASRTRTVASLKQAVSKQFRGRPPQSIITLIYHGQELHDDTTVADILVDELQQDTDSRIEKDDTEEENEERLESLNILVDIIPPVDPKFGTELKERLASLTAQELLDAYVANLAMIHRNSMDIADHMPGGARERVSSSDDDDDESLSSHNTFKTTIAMRTHAISIKEEIVRSLSQDMKNILLGIHKNETFDQDTESGNGDKGLRQSIRGKLRKKKGGASMNVKRALQTQLNIDWPTTVRNSLLFLFFGYFGGRNAFSRTVMLLGAPACFVLQARPAKVFMKQLFYAIGEPPSIMLSLLPAPQQAIMSYHYNEAILKLYGQDSGNVLLATKEGDDEAEEEDDDNDDDDEKEILEDDDDDVEEKEESAQLDDDQEGDDGEEEKEDESSNDYEDDDSTDDDW